MKRKFKKLMLEQVQKNLSPFLILADKPRPREGWLKTIRQALGMSSSILAQRLHCSRSNIIKMEQRETKGTISLESLDTVAQAMNCKLVYCIVPVKPLENQLEEQARLLAKKRIMAINHSMKLEEQGLTPQQLQKQEDNLVQELLQDDPKKLWNTKFLVESRLWLKKDRK